MTPSTHFIYMASDTTPPPKNNNNNNNKIYIYKKTPKNPTTQNKTQHPLPPLHGLLFPISSNGSFICTIPNRIVYTAAFVTPVVEQWLDQKIDPTTYRIMSERSTTKLHLAPASGADLEGESKVSGPPPLPPQI